MKIGGPMKEGTRRQTVTPSFTQNKPPRGPKTTGNRRPQQLNIVGHVVKVNQNWLAEKEESEQLQEKLRHMYRKNVRPRSAQGHSKDTEKLLIETSKIPVSMVRVKVIETGDSKSKKSSSKQKQVGHSAPDKTKSDQSTHRRQAVTIGESSQHGRTKTLGRISKESSTLGVGKPQASGAGKLFPRSHSIARKEIVAVGFMISQKLVIGSLLLVMWMIS